MNLLFLDTDVHLCLDVMPGFRVVQRSVARSMHEPMDPSALFAKDVRTGADRPGPRSSRFLRWSSPEVTRLRPGRRFRNNKTLVLSV